MYSSTLSFAPLQQDLPDNIHLLSLFLRSNESVSEHVLRLQHIFEKGQTDNDLSQNVTIDLYSLFKYDLFSPLLFNITEKTLSLLIDLDQLQRQQWLPESQADDRDIETEVSTAPYSNKKLVTINNDDGSSMTYPVTFSPIQIKTYTLNLA